MADSNFLVVDHIGDIGVVRAVHFAYFYQVFMDESTCEEIPQGSTVLVLGFEYPGEVDGVIDPGLGNVDIATQLAGCADRLEQIVTQKAVSDAMTQKGWVCNGKLLGKVPVRQMHLHQPGANVRTLQALAFALKSLDPLPETLVLLAHDKQIERAFLDLHSLYTGQIVLWKRNDVPYAHAGWWLPLRWAVRELYLARPVEFWNRWMRSRYGHKTIQRIFSQDSFCAFFINRKK